MDTNTVLLLVAIFMLFANMIFAIVFIWATPSNTFTKPKRETSNLAKAMFEMRPETPMWKTTTVELPAVTPPDNRSAKKRRRRKRILKD